MAAVQVGFGEPRHSACPETIAIPRRADIHTTNLRLHRLLVSVSYGSEVLVRTSAFDYWQDGLAERHVGFAKEG